MWQTDEYETTIDAQTAPPGWDGKGLMTLVRDDDALYVDGSGSDVLFRPADEVPDSQCG